MEGTGSNRPRNRGDRAGTTGGKRRRASAPLIAHGLKGIVVSTTRLSHVDGERGELLIAGIPLAVLAPNAAYEDALFLLWHDRVPTPEESAALRGEMAALRAVPDTTLRLLRAAAERAVPAMDALRMGVATLSLIDPAPGDDSVAGNLRRAMSLVARFPTLVAAFARMQEGLAPIEPRTDLSHAANYLYMLTGSEPAAAVARALETYFNTVVDHGMNASTFVARVIVSTRSDMVSALVGAIGALKGPLHGGAPGPALDMVFAIADRARASARSIADEADAYVRETLAGGGRIMGFGHRVYKVRDPRADVLAQAAVELFARTGDHTLYDMVRTVEAAVVRTLAELKPGRRLETNVEFYTALVLHGIGLSTALFTPTFAVGRAGGWTAHVLEQIAADQLIRPDSVYIGPRDRTWALSA
jgi:citrate synthase